MKRILLLLAIAATTLTAEAQDEFTFGKIRKAELRMLMQSYLTSILE